MAKVVEFFKMKIIYKKGQKSTSSFQQVLNYLIFKEITLKKGVETLWKVLESVDEFLSFQHFPHLLRVKYLIYSDVEMWKLKRHLTPINTANIFFKT